MPTEDGKSLRIYMPSAGADYIDCWATRWDEDNYNVTIETFLGSANRNLLFSNVAPGIIRELKNILGKPWYLDGTFRKDNTLTLQPIYGYGLSGVRQKREIAVKNISDNFITPNYFRVKVEGVRVKSDTG